MSANATDLRHHYAETLGPSALVALSNATARSAVLEPGRYIARVRAVAGGAVALWLRQGGSTVVAAAAAPSTPFEIGGTTTTAGDVRFLNEVLFSFIVRGGDAKDDQIAGILDAGTASLVLTKVSRGAS